MKLELALGLISPASREEKTFSASSSSFFLAEILCESGAYQLGRGPHRNREPEKWPEVLRGRHTRDEQAWNRAFEMIVENGKTVLRFESLKKVTGEIRQARDIDLVSGCEDDLIDVQFFSIA